MNRQLYRFAIKTGDKKIRFLTKAQIELANILNIQFHPIFHRARYEEIEVECPAPEICGYFVVAKDEDLINRMMPLYKKDSGLIKAFIKERL